MKNVSIFCASLAFFGLVQSGSSQLTTRLVTSGLVLPVALVQDSSRPHCLFVVEQRSATTGRIRVLINGVLQTLPFLSISPVSVGSEQGLLGMALHPNYASNRLFYVNYTDSAGDTRIVEYMRDPANPNLALPASARLILFVDQPFTNHNGGTLRFGPDGFLYIGLGDGGSANDPGNRSQTLSLALGKMLRIDPSGDDYPADANRNYRIPAGNPFSTVGQDFAIWACGLRNPWKYAFDNPIHYGNGALWIGDVGQNNIEEIDYEPATVSGRNYGWRQWEGNNSTGLGGTTSGITPTFPIHTYTHAVGFSVTGGHVYRGTLLPVAEFGNYFFADYVTNQIWSFKYDGVNLTNFLPRTGELTPSATSAIEVDGNGEIYLLNLGGGTVRQVIPVGSLGNIWTTDVSQFWGDEFFTGGMKQMRRSDNDYLVMEQTTIAETTDGNEGAIVLGMTTDKLNLLTLNVTVEMRTGEPAPSGNMVIAFRNWTTGMFENQAPIPVTNADAVYTLNGIATNNYVRQADGRMELKLKTYNNAVLQSDPFLTYFDHVQVRVGS